MEQESVNSIENRPKPTDFDVFLPWACKEFRIDAEVIVSRAVQEVYVSAVIAMKKLSQKRRLSRVPSFVVTQDPTSHDEYQSADIDDVVPNVPEKIVNIETIYDSYEKLVQIKFMKNDEIPREIIQVLALTIPFQQHLTSITINSGLHVESLYELSKCLPNSQITELCLDGTSVIQGNYYILLTHGKLKHLSLARCSLNDDTVKMIVEQLKEPYSAAKILSALNLSMNRITDIGAKHLAGMLRANRKLNYLNLAGNMITDVGGVAILNTLQKFPLKNEELVESRARNVAYLAKRNELINSFITELQTTATVKNYSKRKMIKRAKLESGSLQQQYDSPAEAQIIQEKAEFLADNQLGPYNEPYSLSNTETHNGVRHCLGNNILCYLNIAYNNLTYASVKKLVEVLTVQKSLDRSPRGLIKVLIEGNSMPEYCTEFEEIDNLLGIFVKSVKKQSEAAFRKKPLSAKSTAR